MLSIGLITLGFIENWENFNQWNPEIAATGGGNNEFQVYHFHPNNSKLINNTLELHPTFNLGDLRIDLDLYAKGCTNNWNFGCFNPGSMHWKDGSLHWINGKPIPVGGYRTKPFYSTKLVSKESFGYGLLSVQFKLPKGNYLWPAIWMLPEDPYPWPMGGEIDLMESMGQDPNSKYALNYKSVSAALHYGNESQSQYYHNFSPFQEELMKKSFDRFNLDEGWHISTLNRTKDNLIIKVNQIEILNVDQMFRLAASSKTQDAPYRDEVLKLGYKAGFKKYSLMMGNNIPEYLFRDLPYDAPFHHNFKLIINLAIGGNFFGDSLNSGPNLAKPDWEGIESGSVQASQFLKNMDKWFNWGDQKTMIVNNDIPTLRWEECIKDERPCDSGKEYYYEQEKYLGFSKPLINDEAAFRIGKINFIPIKS